MIDKKKLADIMANQDPNTTLEVQNPEVEAQMEVYKNEGTPDNLNILLNKARRGRFLVPANVDTEKKQPIPIFIKNEEGGCFIPIYTNKEHAEKAPKCPAILNMPFLSIVAMAVNSKIDIAGIVLNPFSNNLVLKDKLLKKIDEVERARAKAAKEGANGVPGKTKAIKLNAKQYAIFERKQFELIFLPNKLFAEGREFIDKLVEKKEQYIDELYEESYQQKKMYPYLEEEFSVMALSITEDFLAIRVDFQERDKSIGCSHRAYITWNESTGEAHYYLIEIAPENKTMVGEIDAEHKHSLHGEAPAEGAELQMILTLAKGEEEITS